jgi:hypothetical protein
LHPISLRSILIFSTPHILVFPVFWLSYQYRICAPLLSHSFYMPRPSHPSWLDHSNYTWRRVQVVKLLLQSPLTSSLFGPNILNTLFSNTRSLCSSLNVRDQVSRPYRATGKL